MFDIYSKWQELERQLGNKNNNIPIFINVFTSNEIDLFIQASIVGDYSMILHINNENSIDINREITGIRIKTYINPAVDSNKPSIIIDNLNKNSINIFKAFSATLYENFEEKRENSDIEDIINKTIDDYKDYFSGIKNDLGELEQQGLYGELLFLKEQLENGKDDALECWEGIYKNKHDFVFKKESIEIKTTKNQTRLNIHISNENQLDNSLVEELKLCVYRLEKVSVGRTILDMSNEIIKLLPIEKHDLFKSKLIKVGFNPSDDNNYYRFREVKKYIFKVDDAFPKIDKMMCGDRIYDVKYYLSLDGIETIEEVTYSE